MKYKLILFFFFISVFLTCQAQKDSGNKVNILVANPVTKESQLTESEAYKMLYENQVNANSEILKTIYYALGGLGTAVLLVFASNWWFNEKKVKDAAAGISAQISEAKNAILAEAREKMNTFSQEKNSEINEALKSLQQEITSVISNLTLKFSDLSEKTRYEIKEDNKIIEATFSERIKSYSENLIMQIKTLEKLLEERINAFTIKISTINAEVNQKFDRKFEVSEVKFNEELNKIKKELFNTAAQMADSNKLYPRAFRNYLEVAKVEEKLGKKISKLTLQSLSESLKKADYIWNDEKDNLVRILANLEGDEELKKIIADELNEKKIEQLGKKNI